MANIIRRMLRLPVSEASSAADDTTTLPSVLSSSPSPSSRYLGRGQLVCVADTGFDTGSTTDVHQAFTGRVKALHAWGQNGTTDDPYGHGTYICGCILGRGQHKLEGRVDGTAPAASLMVQSFFTKSNGQGQILVKGGFDDLGPLFNEAYTAGARIHNNSWGKRLLAKHDFKGHPYDVATESIDRFLWDHQDMTVLFAAGNDGEDAKGHINERSILSYPTAKNCITVGASEKLPPTRKSSTNRAPRTNWRFWRQRSPNNNRQANNAWRLAAFSSRGPTADDRIKPDVVAPGTDILSARSRSRRPANGIDYASSLGDEDYRCASGTSASVALVSGCCAVIREALLANGYRDVSTAAPSGRSGHGPSPAPAAPNPTGSLIKALLINGAVPVEVQDVPNHQGPEPNAHSGYGRVHVGNTLAMIEPEVQGMGGYGIGSIAQTDEPFVVRIAVPSPPPNRRRAAARGLTFKVTMAYADLPGPSLVDDLNLVAVSVDGTKQRHGNQGDQEFPVGSETIFDHRNNVEQIVWPRVPKGSVEVMVKPYRRRSAEVAFAYAWRFSRG